MRNPAAGSARVSWAANQRSTVTRTTVRNTASSANAAAMTPRTTASSSTNGSCGSPVTISVGEGPLAVSAASTMSDSEVGK